MAKPQQPELHRNGLTAADPASVKSRPPAPQLGGEGGGVAPVPEANTPGHHPDEEQDKPVEAFAEKVAQLAEDGSDAGKSDGGD